MTEKQPTCDERIAERMESREEYVAGLRAVIDGEATTFDGDYDPAEEMTEDDASERLNELPLGVSVERVLRIDLSTGGPADYITATLEKDRHGWEIADASYHFADWFDHAERNIDRNSPLWRLAEYYAEIVEE